MRSAWFVCLLAFFFALPLHARVSGDLIPNDPVYRHLETLVASGLIDSLMIGQRPLARSDVARMVEEAKARLPEFRDRLMHATGGFEITTQRMRHLNYVEAIIHYLSTTLIGPPTHFYAHHHMTSLAGTLLDQDRRVVTATTGDGSIDTSVFPLTDYVAGREFGDGVTGNFESQHQLQLGSAVHLFLHPRVAVTTGSGPAQQFALEPQQAYVKTGLRHVELTVGRETVQWGPGAHGGLGLSDNARPLDLVRVATPMPIALPVVGRFKGTALFAYLHDDVSSPHAVLSGYRLDLQPHRTITIGWQHLVMLGGQGRRNPNVGQSILAFGGFPFAGHATVDANHSYAMDLSARIPRWRDMAVYVQLFIDDVERRWSQTFERNAAWLLGVQMPRASYDGGWDFRLEFTRAGAAAFRHDAYTSGWTLAGRGLGAPVGPDSEQLELIATRDNVLGTEVLLTTRLTHRNGAADEWSTATTATLHHPLTPHVALHVATGYEHAWNANFTGNTNTSNGLGELGIAVSY